MADAELKELFDRVKQCFPEEKRALFREPLGETDLARLAEAFPNGHARRWFELTDGQREDEAFVDGFRLFSLHEASVCCVELKLCGEGEQPRDVSLRWCAIAANGGLQLMIDDLDGQVFVASEDESPKLVAASVSAWLKGLLERVESGEWVWDEALGLSDRSTHDWITRQGAPTPKAWKFPNLDWRVLHLVVVLLTIGVVAWMASR